VTLGQRLGNPRNIPFLFLFVQNRPFTHRTDNSEVKAVTVQVTPEQAEKLVLAANEGKLQVVMRNYGEQ